MAKAFLAVVGGARGKVTWHLQPEAEKSGCSLRSSWLSLFSPFIQAWSPVLETPLLTFVAVLLSSVKACTEQPHSDSKSGQIDQEVKLPPEGKPLLLPVWITKMALCFLL